LLHFTLGVKLLSARASLAHLLWSPLNLALLLGLASSASGLKPPEPINQGLRMLGEGMLPMMLFALGVRLNDLSLRGLQLGLAGALLRPVSGLALAPLVVAAFAWFAPLSAEARAQLFLYAALPPAVLNFMLADRYGHEPQLMAAIVLAGNALALLFVPIGLALGLSPAVGAWLGSP
ncbi:MAG: AEC family transporter, partial [Burkholderiaceae bacterium]|nr:AEC family transporter [Burkholderiaceae bacterium]